ncbi:MAG: hypothetical protein JSW23_11225 [Planctomycetota bacterium]|nr:MAG: hypothetical protein JSW23_11225 [Planctomycetota bacterium]
MKIVGMVPRFDDCDDVIKRYCRKNFKAPCSIELIYVPFVLFRYRIELTSLFGRRKTEKGIFLVDSLQGIPVNIKKNTKFVLKDEGLRGQFDGLLGPALIDSTDLIKDEKTITVSIKWQDVAEEQILPAALDEKAAIKAGKNLLMYDIMKLTGGLRYRRVDVVPEPQTQTLYYPYWLIYYRDKKNNMRFDVLDALSGQKEGGQIIRSVKIGLVEKQKSSQNVNIEKGASEN